MQKINDCKNSACLLVLVDSLKNRKMSIKSEFYLNMIYNLRNA